MLRQVNRPPCVKESRQRFAVFLFISLCYITVLLAASPFPLSVRAMTLTDPEGSSTYVDDGDHGDSIGSHRDFAAYRKEFEAYGGIPFPFARDPRASYAVDYAHELAYERYMEEGDWGSPPPPSDLTPHRRGRTADRDDIELDFKPG